MSAAVILVSGFEPFGGSDRNPSADLARALAGSMVHGVRVEAVILPVVTVAAGDLLAAAIDRHAPTAVVAMGEDGRASAIRVESTAVNRREFASPDNAGNVLRDAPVVAGGPASLPSTLPIAALVAASRACGVEAEESPSAGTYLCNEVMYRLLHRLRGEPSRRGGFLHVPRLPAQGPAPKGGVPMPLDLTLRGVRAMLEALAAAGPARA